MLVTANYKMSFDRLRAALHGIDAWILVLDTNGINVWCAAGKGTFGTEELVSRIETVRLDKIVSHRRLILPQLGAPGVNMHEVKRLSGFRIVYGPVRAVDLPIFLDAGLNATPEMRRVRFQFRDRIVLVPVELTMWLIPITIAAICFFALAGLIPWGFSIARMLSAGTPSVLLLAGAYLSGVALMPMLLPWLPGRSFSAKGAWIGLAYMLCIGLIAWTHSGLFENRLSMAAWFFIAPALASFTAMNFTGASTYTSLSGVRREMRTAVPFQLLCAAAGIGMWLAGRFV